MRNDESKHFAALTTLDYDFASLTQKMRKMIFKTHKVVKLDLIIPSERDAQAHLHCYGFCVDLDELHGRWIARCL